MGPPGVTLLSSKGVSGSRGSLAGGTMMGKGPSIEMTPRPAVERRGTSLKTAAMYGNSISCARGFTMGI